MLKNHEIKEVTEGQVVITDITPDVMAQVLECIYTGIVEDNMSTELLYAGDKYMLVELV